MVYTKRMHVAESSFFLPHERRMTSCAILTHSNAFMEWLMEIPEFRAETWEEMRKKRLITYSTVCFQTAGESTRLFSVKILRLFKGVILVTQQATP